MEQGIQVRGPPLLLFQVKKLHFPEALRWIEGGSVLRVQRGESEVQTAVRDTVKRDPLVITSGLSVFHVSQFTAITALLKSPVEFLKFYTLDPLLN